VTTFANTHKRKLKVLKARASSTLVLPQHTTPEAIRRRYKEKLKMQHPDANRGDRDSEDQMQAAIEAYKILKTDGFC